METGTKGKVLVTAKVENPQDLWDVQRGMITDEQVRRVEVSDALVDTGATSLSMPKRMIEQMGLLSLRPRHALTSAGPTTFRVFGGVRLTVHGRDCICDVAELPDDCRVLIGQIPLDGLDLVVDTVGRRLIGNPEHGGEHMIEMY